MDMRDLIIQHLGGSGRMISGSKSEYIGQNPGNLVVFNANVFVQSSKQKIWYGDIDITKDMDMIKGLAADLGVVLVVLRESDGRFEMEQAPNMKNFVFLTDGNIHEYGPGASSWLSRKS